MITVRDVWRGALPEGTELIAGGAGLERRVEWATSLRTRPPAFEAIKGGELAFIPVKSIRILDDRLDLAQVMASLAEKGGVAVAVVGPVSAEAIAVSDRMMLPLLKLPDTTSIPDVQHFAVRYILDQRTRLHEKEHELRLELTELALAGAGIAAISDRLAEICGCAVVWQEADGQVRHRAGKVSAKDAELAAALEPIQRWLLGTTIAAADPPVHELDVGATLGLVSPIPQRNGVGGFISVLDVASHSAQLARIGVARAASASAIELDRTRAVLEVRDDIEGDVAEVLLSGSYNSEAAIAERARRIGVELKSMNAVILLATAQRNLLDEGERDVHRWAELHIGKALFARQSKGMVIVVPNAESLKLDLMEQVQLFLDDLPESLSRHPVSAGIGRPALGVAGVRTSFDEAQQAATMSRRLYGPGRALAFAQMRLHKLLFAIANNPEVRIFHDETLGKLRDYDERTHSGLLPTLEAFFECQGSPTEMAARLHLHRNTVLYRLRRIEEVGDVNLNSAMTRLCLHLGLRIGDVVGVVH